MDRLGILVLLFIVSDGVRIILNSSGSRLWTELRVMLLWIKMLWINYASKVTIHVHQIYFIHLFYIWWSWCWKSWNFLLFGLFLGCILLVCILIFCLVLYDQWCYGFPYFWTLNWMKCECIWSDFVFWKWMCWSGLNCLWKGFGLALRKTWTAQCNPPGRSARWRRLAWAEEGGPPREAVSFSRRRLAEGSGPWECSASSLGIGFQWTVSLLLLSVVLLCFWLLLDCFVGYSTMSLEYLFMSFIGYFIP